jgi:anti-anti-sigma regulatory factor
MRYRIRELKGSLIIKLDGQARDDEAARIHRTLLPLLQRPGVNPVLNLAGLREFGIPELEVLGAIRQEVKAQGGTLRLYALQDTLRAQFDWNPFLQVYALYHDLESSLTEMPDLPLKRSA